MSMLTGRISDTLTCPPFVTRLSNIQSVACRRGHITVRILLSPHHGSMLTTPARPVDSSSKALENQHQKQLEQQVRHTPGILDDTTQPQKKRSKPKTRNPRRPPAPQYKRSTVQTRNPRRPPSPHAKTRNPRRPPTHPQKRSRVRTLYSQTEINEHVCMHMAFKPGWCTRLLNNACGGPAL